MATLIAGADGNWTAAATWRTVDPTSLLDNQGFTFLAATAPTFSSGAAFTPGAITIDGIAVKIGTRASSPSGTFTVRLFNVTGAAAVAGTTVTVNVTDIPLHTSQQAPGSTFNTCGVGWMFFKFAAPVTLLAATSYRVDAQSSVASMVTLFRDSTASNFCRMLRTTTTAAPAAGDNAFVLGEWTAAATKTDRTVTMDSTAATDYGGGSTTLAALGIATGGTLQYAFAAATNYVLRLSGVLQVWVGGVFTIGTVANPIPRGSTAVLEFDNAASGDFGAVIFGTFIAQGLSRTAGKNHVYALLAADLAVAGTVVTLDRDTGWLAGDEVCITGTTQTRTDGEVVTLASPATATTITASAGVALAHGGTNPIRAEALLLTRPVTIRSTLATAGAYVQTEGTPTVDVDWVLFHRIWGLANNNKSGFLQNHLGGTVACSFCATRDGATNSFHLVLGGITASPFAIDNFTAYAAEAISAFVQRSSTTTAAVILTDVATCCDSNGGGAGWILAGSGAITLTRVFHAGGTDGCVISAAGPSTVASLTDVASHSAGSGAAGALSLTGRLALCLLTNVDLWRSGATTGGLTVSTEIGLILGVNCRLFGSNASNIGCTANWFNARFLNSIIAGDTTFATARGFNFAQAAQWIRLRLENCNVGVASGIYVAHTTADLGTSISAVQSPSEFTLVNTTLGSATEIEAAVATNLSGDAFLARQRKDGATNVHERLYFRLGTVTYETTTFRTATPSEKLTPAVTPLNGKLKSSRKRIAVPKNMAATISVYVQRNVAYTGALPRLVVLANPALGLDNDTVLDTMTGISGVWRQLTGITTPVAEEDGVLECYVDCDGAAGAVYIDDWSATVA